MKVPSSNKALAGSPVRLGNPNKVIAALFLCISAVGLFILLDISAARDTMQFFWRQGAYFVFSLVMVVIASYLDINRWRKYIPLMLYINILLLVAVLVVGATVKGATRAIHLGPLSLQPSNFSFIVIVLYTAHVFDKQKDALPHCGPVSFLAKFLVYFVMVGAVFALILLERHLSPLIIMSGTLITMYWAAELRKKTILVYLLIALIGGVSIISFGAKYRSSRIDIYKKYSLFYKMAGYQPAPPDTTLSRTERRQIYDKERQVSESLTALANGRLWGTTPDGGRGKHYYLSEARTDYVFTIIGEEFGLLGALLVFGMYIMLFVTGLKVSFQHDDMFLRLAGTGLATAFFLNVIINIGVAISALPSTGVTLPFISYGGSSYLFSALGLGILLDISRKRRLV